MKLFKLLEAKYGKNIDLSDKSLATLPIDLPSKVEGNFICHYNQLTSLQYCPTSVGGDFSCSRNQLPSLHYCPTSVGRIFYCANNQLKSLKYLPKEIGRDINLSNNPDCYEELWRLCQTKLGGKLIIEDNEKLADLFNNRYKNVGHGREMLRFQMEILDII